MDTKDIIDKLILFFNCKNRAALAKLFGKEQSAITNWINRNSLNFKDLYQMLKETGKLDEIDFNWLLKPDEPEEEEREYKIESNARVVRMPEESYYVHKLTNEPLSLLFGTKKALQARVEHLEEQIKEIDRKIESEVTIKLK